MIEILLLPRYDAVANEEQRRQKDKEDPSGIEKHRQSSNDHSLPEIIGIPAEPIRARDDQLTAGTPRGDGCPSPTKMTDYRATEGKATHEEESARDTEGDGVKKQGSRPPCLEK